MTSKTPQEGTLPTSKEFREWASRAITKLGVHHSDLMRDDTPGSRNRALTGLHKSKGVKLDFAQALERELLDIAARKGVDIGTWRTDQDSGADDE